MMKSGPLPGRKLPEGVILSVRYPYNIERHTSKWKDLCWYDERRDVWVYLSTLPA